MNFDKKTIEDEAITLAESSPRPTEFVKGFMKCYERFILPNLEKLNGDILVNGDPDCPLCHGRGEYYTGGSFGGPITVHRCKCGNQGTE